MNLYFEQFGDGHRGPPLIILHGFFASSRNWRTLARQLAGQRRVYVLDLRNHGASPHAEQMDYLCMAEDVLAFMQQQGLSRADLLGHSMGGKIAMWLALNHPDCVNELLVADISPVSYSHNFDNTIQALRQLNLPDLANRKQAEQQLALMIPDLSYRQFLLQNLQLEQGVYQWRINLDYFQANAQHIVAFPALDGVRPYDKPVLFLSGEQSYYIHRAAIEAVFPQAQIIEIAGTGHWLHVEAPDLFIQHAEGWLNR